MRIFIQDRTRAVLLIPDCPCRCLHSRFHYLKIILNVTVDFVSTTDAPGSNVTEIEEIDYGRN